jgi:hypothetical protein
MLTLGKDEEIASIVIGRGPSRRDGLDEGDYSKKFLLDNFDRLEEFELLKPLFAQLSGDERAALRRAMENVVITSEVLTTLAEITEAAKIFNEAQVDKVIQISAASHAPRCIKQQSVLQRAGVINKSQLWQTVATDMSYHGTKPEDVCVIEPLHRLDQPLTYIRPGLSEVILPYFSFNDEEKKAFIKTVDEFMTTRNHLP